MEEEYLQLSGLQHFAFCRRQWALIHIENQWKESYHTAAGRAEHDRVHNAAVKDYRGVVITIHGTYIHSDKLRLSGQCDAIELIPDENGIELFGRKGLWRVQPVEYKHGSSKTNDCDRLQAAAQAMCLEEMMKCQIDQACLFYAKTRRREIIEINEALRGKVISSVREMHDYFDRKYTPKVKPTKACSSCSLADICLPELNKGTGSDMVAKYIKKHVEEMI